MVRSSHRLSLAPAPRPKREASAADLRTLLRLGGEATEIADPFQRSVHVLEGVRQLVGATAVGHGRIVSDALGRPMQMDGRSSVMAGLDLAALRMIACDFYSGEPVTEMRFAFDEPVRTDARRFKLLPRERMLDFADWRRGIYYNEILRPTRIDVVSMSRLDDAPRGLFGGLVFMREPDDAPADGRMLQIQEIVHADLFRHIMLPIPNTVVAAPELDPALTRLPPRLKPILAALLTGEGAKQTAYRLGFSVHTVYEYQKQLYRTLGVSGRHEVMARYVKR